MLRMGLLGFGEELRSSHLLKLSLDLKLIQLFTSNYSKKEMVSLSGASMVPITGIKNLRNQVANQVLDHVRQ